MALPRQGGVKGSDPSSALSYFSFRVDRLQLHPSVVDFELPIDSSLSGVAVIVPRCRFLADFLNRCKSTTRNALPGHRTQLVLGDV